MTKISCYHGARLGWGFQADLTSSQGSVWWATRDPGVWSRIVVGGGRCSQQSTPCSVSVHPSSLPYILTLVGTELTETSSQGNEGRELNQEVGCACAVTQHCLLTACLSG